jgi:hypothetical protein
VLGYLDVVYAVLQEAADARGVSEWTLPSDAELAIRLAEFRFGCLDKLEVGVRNRQSAKSQLVAGRILVRWAEDRQHFPLARLGVPASTPLQTGLLLLAQARLALGDLRVTEELQGAKGLRVADVTLNGPEGRRRVRSNSFEYLLQVAEREWLDAGGVSSP